MITPAECRTFELTVLLDFFLAKAYFSSFVCALHVLLAACQKTKKNRKLPLRCILPDVSVLILCLLCYLDKKMLLLLLARNKSDRLLLPRRILPDACQVHFA